MKQNFIIGIFLLSILPVCASAQWFGKNWSIVGNWSAYSDNQGRVFNNANVAGGKWDTTGLVFGAGLWIGGQVNTPNGQKSEVAMSYNPNNASSMFIPGSYSPQNPFLDTVEATSSKYWPLLSTNVNRNLWPMRLVGGIPSYIDSIPDRAKAGSPYYIGDEDIFTIYKNTDPVFWGGHDSLVPMPQFEIRTQMAFWKKGLGRDVVMVKNELIYLSKDTLFNPVIALAFDGDIGSGGPDAANNKMRGFIDQGVQGCLFSTGPNVKATKPLLGVYLLRGISGTNRTDPGITTLRRWTIANDPQTSVLRYNFMSNGVTDVTDNNSTGDMRALIGSESQKPLHHGDTIFFD